MFEIKYKIRNLHLLEFRFDIMMPSSTKFQTTLQRLKEQIVSLTVEHEDKGHFLALLEKKCAQKREELTNLSEKYSKEAELVLEVLFANVILNLWFIFQLLAILLILQW